MIKRIKNNKLPSLKDLDVEVLLIEYDDYFEAHLGKHSGHGESETDALNDLSKKVQGQEIVIKDKLIKIPLLRLL